MSKKRGFFSRLFKPVSDYFEEGKRKRQIKKNLRKEPVNVKFKEIEKITGNLDDFEKFLREYGKIGIILGARGSGKSALGIKILENINASGKRVFAMGFREDRLPKWIKPVKDIKEISNNSFLLADEAGIEFSSRNSMTAINKLLSELIIISRHKNISIIFITQNSSNIEVNTIRQADYLLLKPSSLLQLDFERKKIRDIYNEVKSRFVKYPGKDVTYVYSDLYRGFVKSTLPGFWTDDLSKSYSK